MSPLATITDDGPQEFGTETDCNCSYQILSVNATLAPGGGNPNGGPDYFFNGGVPTVISGGPGVCAGTFNNCGGECLGFSAYGSVNPSGCTCHDPINCDDFIYDDLDPSNGSPYPTQFFPFNCGVPVYSDLRIRWTPNWRSPDCTGNYFLGAPSSLTFRIRCSDPISSDEECGHLSQSYYSPPITLQMTELIQTEVLTTVELIDCGCKPVEK